ncbi:homeobox protein NANOG isoform X2 [Sturnira hondurensis]|uniref:homeobox protein NANOG isoform X2 n=1 Tax=Sturnira hondurensis TaxID=192404 RepID=UPI001879FF61|nr:homeobox protein NANOG isoform X2 [Sturnira hondurensis]
MSVDSASPQSLPCLEASNSREPSPVPEVYEPDKNYASLPMSSSETLHTETVSPLPSSMDLLIQNSPDSSTSPSIILPTSVEDNVAKEEKGQVKKQKVRTVFSQTQLCVLNERFQRQKYLSLQQMQELSNVLNLSYKQIKTWFQNQRMKCKRWQKYNWPKSSNHLTQGYVVNASGNLPMWSNQACSNLSCSNPSWNSPSWNYHSCNSQAWCPQTWTNQVWTNQFYGYGEESLQPQIQVQQTPISDLEVTLETAGESYDATVQTPMYYSSQQTMDLFPDYYMNMQPDSTDI